MGLNPGGWQRGCAVMCLCAVVDLVVQFPV